MVFVVMVLHTVELEIVKVVLALLRPPRQAVLSSQRMVLVVPSTMIGFAGIVNGVRVAQTMVSAAVMRRIVELAYAVRPQIVTIQHPSADII
jgi:hypothetical protein